jgi:hypothetical protein
MAGSLITELQALWIIWSVQRAGWLTHTSHKDTEQGIIHAITLDGVTLTDPLIRWSPNEWPSVCR